MNTSLIYVCLLSSDGFVVQSAHIEKFQVETTGKLTRNMDTVLREKILIRRPGAEEAVRKQYNLDGSRRDEAVNILRDWLEQQPHILKKDFSSNYLEMLIISSKGSIERAKKKIDKRCTFRTLMPKYFGYDDPKILYEHLNGNVETLFIPKQTPDMYRIYVTRAYRNMYTRDNMMNYYRFNIFLADYVFNFDCMMNGMILVYDISQISITDMMAFMNFMDLKNKVTILLGAYGMRVQAIHIISNSAAVETFIAIVRPWLGPKIASRISVLNSSEEMSKLYPPDILPTEFGGTQGPIHDMFVNWVNALSTEENKQRIKDMDRAATDETLRADDVKFSEDYAGVSGTFRYLKVD